MVEVNGEEQEKGEDEACNRCLSLPSTCSPDRCVGGNVGLENCTGIATLERFCNSLSPSRRAITFSSREFHVAIEREEKWDGWMENVIILMNIWKTNAFSSIILSLTNYRNPF